MQNVIKNHKKLLTITLKRCIMIMQDKLSQMEGLNLSERGFKNECMER